MGHETGALVTKIGKNVKTLKVGDKVCIEPGIPCRMCDICKKGYCFNFLKIFIHNIISKNIYIIKPNILN